MLSLAEKQVKLSVARYVCVVSWVICSWLDVLALLNKPRTEGSKEVKENRILRLSG